MYACIGLIQLLILFEERLRGCELACDEAVLRRLGDVGAHAYGDTLLWQARFGKREDLHVFSLLLSKSGNQLKERLEAIMKRKNKSMARTFTALTLSVLLTGGAGTMRLCTAGRIVTGACK